jgi:hypothetical protein
MHLSVALQAAADECDALKADRDHWRKRAEELAEHIESPSQATLKVYKERREWQARAIAAEKVCEALGSDFLALLEIDAPNTTYELEKLVATWRKSKGDTK